MLDLETDPAQWAELNWEFHAALYRPAAMPHLLVTLQMLHVNVGRYLVLYLADMAFHQQSQAEHYALLDACKAGDIDRSQRLLNSHLSDACHALITYLQTNQETNNDSI
jgi:DNA-binding GntR family transcriptional regulator